MVSQVKQMKSITVWEWLPLALATVLFVIHITVQQNSIGLSRTAQAQLDRYSQLERQSALLIQLLTDAETGQRGYLLTSREAYLEPYANALQRLPAAKESFLDLLPAAARRQADEAITSRVEILQRTVALHRSRGRQGIEELLHSDIGKRHMDEVRRVVAEVQSEARGKWTQRVALLERSLQRASWLIYLLGGSVCVLMAVGTWRLVSSIARSDALFRALSVQQDQYHRLAILLQRGHEEERASMARRVHDEIGQTLTAAKMDIGMGMRKMNDPDIARPTLQRAIEALEETLQTTRAIATELRPPILDQLGLAAAVDWQLREFQSRFAGTAKWEAELDEQHLSSEAKLALFRVLQEALTNIVRHAKAKNVEIRLERTGDEVAMSVIDDGVGMNPTHAAHKSLGLLGMRERVRAIGGELEIHSEIGKGATVTARVPATVET